jgi:uncharacterized protein YjbI with pentapeptide repeats
VRNTLFLGLAAIVIVSVVAGCGGSGVRVIDGCKVEPETQCPGKNFSNQDLHGANFGGANLRAANFTGANLTGANFAGADLQGALFTNANLTKAILNGADIWYADMTGTTFTETMCPAGNLVTNEACPQTD